MTSSAEPLVLLAGNPNSGKSTLFNALTGSRQKIGNFPGVTVEKKSGMAISSTGSKLEVIDLPGIYSLKPNSPDEEITFQMLHKKSIDHHPVVTVAVIDVTQLERSLSLVLELKTLGKPIIVVLNMMDMATRLGMKIDLLKLRKHLGMPVIPIIARQYRGVRELVSEVEKHFQDYPTSSSAQPKDLVNDATERYRMIDEIVKDVVSVPAKQDIWTERIDRFLLHPIGGGVFLIALLFLMFQAVFSWSEAPMTAIEEAVAFAGEVVARLLGQGLVSDLIVDGAIAGVGAVLVFLPQIIILFLFIFLMEGSGYMARAALILDRFMAIFGLQGRSFVPLLSSFACAIPGIMATRTIKEPRDRLATLLAAPLMTCSARLPVYVLLIGAFIPDQTVAGVFNLQGVVMFSLFVFGTLSALFSAFFMKIFLLKGPKTPLLLELPTYRWPDMRNIITSIWLRAKVFTKKAGTVIMAVAVVLWVLSTFPRPPADWQEPAIHYSFAGRIGHVIAPVVAPLGFDWRIATGLIPGFGAREVMVGALATLFAVEAQEQDRQVESLQQKISNQWSLATGLSLLIWYIFSPQCLATFAAMRRETMGWKWPAVSFVYMLSLAYLFSWMTYQFSRLFLDL